MRYAILERPPFPGRWGLLHTCYLQMAEYALKFNRAHYHERAEKRGDMLLYRREDAQAIIDFQKRRYPHSELMMMAAPDSIEWI